MTARRPCAGPCGQNRAERFFTSPRGRICIDCQRRQRKTTARRSHVTRTYGLTPDDHLALERYNGGACHICDEQRPYNLAVDHDHTTHAVRGLLCKRCNKLLRDVRDNTAVLRQAADYLEHTPAEFLRIRAVHRDGRT